MGSNQGYIARKLLPEIGQAMAVVAASSSSPSPFPHTDRTYLASPFDRNPQLKPIMLILIAFLIAAFFVIGFLSAHFQHCYTHSAHLSTGLYNHPSGHTWGLDASILETLPKVIFSSAAVQPQKKEEKKKKQQTTTTECVICLEEFQDQEMLQLLPPCGHTFHLECINVWFFSHTSCPLCRCSLLHLNTVAIVVAVASPNDVSIAANLVPTEEALQTRAAGNPSEEGESSEEEESHCAELRRSCSMGHSVAKAGFKPPASSSPSLRSFIVRRSSSCTVLTDLWKSSEGRGFV